MSKCLIKKDVWSIVFEEMKLKPELIKKLTQLILDNLHKNKLITVRTSEKTVFAQIENVLLADAQLEDDLELLAKKTMEQFRKQVESGEIDYHKMFQMVKKQLMKEKKFIP